MKYEITIRQLEEFTPEEKKEANDRCKYPGSITEVEYSRRYSDRLFHETRTLYAELTPEEFQAVKKAVIGVI